MAVNSNGTIIIAAVKKLVPQTAELARPFHYDDIMKIVCEILRGAVMGDASPHWWWHFRRQ